MALVFDNGDYRGWFVDYRSDRYPPAHRSYGNVIAQVAAVCRYRSTPAIRRARCCPPAITTREPNIDEIKLDELPDVKDLGSMNQRSAAEEGMREAKEMMDEVASRH